MEASSIEPEASRPRRESRRACWAAKVDDGGTEPALTRINVPGTGNVPERSIGANPENLKGGHEGQADLVPVEKRSHLGYFSTTALILNKIIGTGIYGAPKVVLTATGSKGISLMIWIVGCVMAWAGLYVYLEYGIRWPVTGGELHYVNNVFTKPYRLFTYIFASIFILINGVQANALQFGKEIILGGSPRNTPVSAALQKFLAIIIITFVCQLQSYSRSIYVQTSNILAVVKVFALVFIVICGLVALTGARKHGPQEIDTPYGTEDLTNIFVSRSNNLNEYSLALLNVMRAFLGYENANFVLTEIKADPRDERRIFRRAMKISVTTSCILYILVNVAFFAVCTTEEIINAPETLPLFLQKIFGASEKANLASSVVVSFSAGGAIIALTFANARVKQEIARMGLLPIPEFWSETSHRRTPAHALFLHWIFTVLCIAVTPLDNAAGFLIMNTLYSYVHTWISILLGCGLLCAPWLPSFKFPTNDDSCWKPQSSSFGWWLLAPLVIIFIATNAFILILSWFPTNLQVALNTTAPTLPYYTGPVTGLSLISFGVLWWTWDLYILPWLGYHFWTKEETYESEHWRVEVLRVNFYRKLDGLAQRVYRFWYPTFARCWKFLARELA